MFNNPITLLKVVLIPLVLGASGYFWMLSNSAVVREMMKETLIPTDRELEAVLYQTGITPEVLTAAGCTPAQVSNVVVDGRAYILENNAWAALQTSQSQIGTAKQQISQLRRLVRSGQADQDQIDALATAKSNLATVESTRDSHLSSILQAALADLSDELAASISTLVTNSHWNLPMEFHAVNRDESDWVELRNALAAERIAIKRSESVDAEVSTLLSSARSESACLAAKSNLEGNGTAVQTAWDLAINTE